MTTSTLANPGRVEQCTFKHDIAGRVIGSATLSTEHSSNTHRLFGIANAQITFAQRMLLAVERNELCAFRLCTDNDFVTFHHIGIKAMHRLSIGHHHIVGNIHDIINRTQSYQTQFVLKPCRTFLDITPRYTHTGITLTSISILYFNLYRQVFIIHLKSIT